MGVKMEKKNFDSTESASVGREASSKLETTVIVKKKKKSRPN
jgi:hypothetical protein